MTPTQQALVDSFSNFKDKTKLAIEDANARAVQETDKLVSNMTTELQQAILDLGAPAGGDFTIAITEAKAVIGAADINVGSANHFSKTVTANTTLTLSNKPTVDRALTFVLHVTNGGAFTVTWWPGIKWAEGTPPTLTAAGRDVIAFNSLDGGATWDGYLLGKDMRAAA